MARLAELPSDMVFFTQITMEAAEDEAFLDAMRRANIKGALVGVEAVTPEGLKDVYKGFNESGEALVQRLRKFREHGVHVLGSFIFGLPSDRPSTFDATADVAERAGLTFAQFVMLTPYPGTVDFEAWEKRVGPEAAEVAGIPITRHWLIPQAHRPKVYAPHPVMTPDEIRARTQAVWDRFYSLPPHLGTLALHAVAPVARRVRVDFEALSTDVRQYGHRDRQRARESCEPMGPPHRATVPPAVRGATDAVARERGAGGLKLSFRPRPFERQQTRLDVEAAGEPGERAVRPDDAMAGRHDRDGIPAVRRTDRARGAGTPDLPRDLPVGSRLAERDRQQRVPHLALKRRA